MGRNLYDERALFEGEDEIPEDMSFDVESPYRIPDDASQESLAGGQVRHLLESVTRIGGEVCRLRAEVDGLLEQNSALNESFEKLKDVIREKGHLDLDDFELACEVLDSGSAEGLKMSSLKKIAH